MGILLYQKKNKTETGCETSSDKTQFFLTGYVFGYQCCYTAGMTCNNNIIMLMIDVIRRINISPKALEKIPQRKEMLLINYLLLLYVLINNRLMYTYRCYGH